jgi:hypothetical protein
MHRPSISRDPTNDDTEALTKLLVPAPADLLVASIWASLFSRVTRLRAGTFGARRAVR